MKIISIHTQHDANLSVQIDGKIVFVLELERIFNQRYFSSSNDSEEFENEWEEALQTVYDLIGVVHFDYAITNWVFPSQVSVLKSIIRANKWLKCSHHHAHAAIGYYTSTLKNPLILSADGGGDDGIFNFYSIQNKSIHLIERNQLNLGTPYRLLATLMPEITNNKPQSRMGHLSLSGKIMGYSALGNIIDSWIEPLKEYYLYYQHPVQALYSLGNLIGLELEEGFCLEKQDAINLAATSQRVFELIVIEKINNKIKNKEYDGIILSGGIALNVIANTKIKEMFNLPIHVSSATNDSGISTGSIFALFPPKKPQNITYIGLPTINNLPSKIKDFGNTFCLYDIAKLLVEEDAIIGVIRNSSEVGPRALGNRSIVCYPNTIQKKEIINKKIKFREWFRPLAPIVQEEKTNIFFDKKIISPYMSFAYPIKKEIQGMFPAIEHLDKTARIQTVTEKQNKWIYDLLEEIDKLTNYPIILNTSFNTRGNPLINSSLEGIKMLKETDLTHVIINDNIYNKEQILSL